LVGLVALHEEDGSLNGPVDHEEVEEDEHVAELPQLGHPLPVQAIYYDVELLIGE